MKKFSINIFYYIRAFLKLIIKMKHYILKKKTMYNARQLQKKIEKIMDTVFCIVMCILAILYILL